MGVGLFLMDCFSWPTTPLPWDLPFIYQTHSIRKYITLAKTWCASHKDLSSFYICDNKDVFKDWFKDILIFWREKYQYSEPFSATWHPEFFGLFHLVKNLFSFTSNMKRSQVDKKRVFVFVLIFLRLSILDITPSDQNYDHHHHHHHDHHHQGLLNMRLLNAPRPLPPRRTNLLPQHRQLSVLIINHDHHQQYKICSHKYVLIICSHKICSHQSWSSPAI